MLYVLCIINKILEECFFFKFGYIIREWLKVKGKEIMGGYSI